MSLRHPVPDLYICIHTYKYLYLYKYILYQIYHVQLPNLLRGGYDE